MCIERFEKSYILGNQASDDEHSKKGAACLLSVLPEKTPWLQNKPVQILCKQRIYLDLPGIHRVG